MKVGDKVRVFLWEQESGMLEIGTIERYNEDTGWFLVYQGNKSAWFSVYELEVM
jgi:hypothetical protein